MMTQALSQQLQNNIERLYQADFDAIPPGGWILILARVVGDSSGTLVVFGSCQQGARAAEAEALGQVAVQAIVLRRKGRWAARSCGREAQLLYHLQEFLGEWLVMRRTTSGIFCTSNNGTSAAALSEILESYVLYVLHGQGQLRGGQNGN